MNPMSARAFKRAMNLDIPFSELKHQARRWRVIVEQDHTCAKCNLNEWCGQPLTLEVDHKDGDKLNNSRDNLEALCPNCHSLTHTWRGCNKANIRNKISEEEFKQGLEEAGSIYQALIFLGLTPKGNNYARAKRIAYKYGIDISYPTGTNSANSKLSDLELKELIQSKVAGEKTSALASKYDLNPRTIRKICRGSGGPTEN